MTRRQEIAHEVIGLLAERFPQTFFIFEQRRRPLALRIDHDINIALNGALSKAELSAGLRHYCGNSGYLQACVAGAARIGLNGEPAGVVTEGEAEHARAILIGRRKKTALRIAQPGKAAETPPKLSTPTALRPATSTPEIPSPKRLGLADLKAAALLRKQATGTP
jgi:sRNA-binding protein